MSGRCGIGQRIPDAVVHDSMGMAATTPSIRLVQQSASYPVQPMWDTVIASKLLSLVDLVGFVETL